MMLLKKKKECQSDQHTMQEETFLENSLQQCKQCLVCLICAGQNKAITLSVQECPNKVVSVCFCDNTKKFDSESTRLEDMTLFLGGVAAFFVDGDFNRLGFTVFRVN